MPGKWPVLWMVATVCAVIVSTITLAACPYCPPTDATLGEKLASSDAACVVKFLDSKNGEELSMQTTLFEVVKPLPSKETLNKGSKITVPFGVTAIAGDHFLLMGQSKAGEIEWNLPISLDETWSTYRYLVQAPTTERSTTERLAYFLKFLPNENAVISNDAFGEFSKARFEDVEQIAPKLSRSQVREWLEDENPQLDVRRDFYGMLLGLCGNDDDALFLEKKLLAPIETDKYRFGIGGMMGGFLLLRGDAGLRFLVEKKLDPLPKSLEGDDPRIVDLNAFRMTLSFLWDYRRSQFGDEPLRAAMRHFLVRREFADLAIVDLARWKDWKSLDRLIHDYGKTPWDTQSAKEKVVMFALSCRKDVSAAPGAPLPPHAAKAQAFLDGLDPEFVQSVKRSIGGPKLVPKPPANAKDDEGRS